jgi:hypothetical protein
MSNLMLSQFTHLLKPGTPSLSYLQSSHQQNQVSAPYVRSACCNAQPDGSLPEDPAATAWVVLLHLVLAHGHVGALQQHARPHSGK